MGIRQPRQRQYMDLPRSRLIVRYAKEGKLPPGPGMKERAQRMNAYLRKKSLPPSVTQQGTPVPQKISWWQRWKQRRAAKQAGL